MTTAAATLAQNELTANDVAVPFYAICFVCNVVMVVVYFTSKIQKSFYNRLILYQAIPDIIWSLVQFLEASHYESAGVDWAATNFNACVFFGMIKYVKLFYTMWDGFTALTMYRKIVRNRSTEKYEKKVAVFCAFWTSLCCILVQTIFPIGPSHPACGPTGPNAIFGTEFLFLGTIYVVIVIVLTCYVLTIRRVYKIWQKVGSRTEDDVHRRAIRHLMFFPFITVIIWTPSIVRRSYEAIHGYTFVLNVFQNVSLPLSGPLNLIVWGLSRKIWRAYRSTGKGPEQMESDEKSASKEQPQELTTPTASLDIGVSSV